MEVVSFTAVGNLQSRRAIENIAMVRRPEDDLHHPRIPERHPLCRHVLYRHSDDTVKQVSLMMKIGFAGLGKMGSAMAQNLIQAGHNIAVYNRTPGKAHALNSEGARVATSPAEAARGADAVFTMLPDDKTESEVTFGENGISSGLASGAYHISCSTISAACARTLDEEHRNRRQGYLSAPVFGRPEAAQKQETAGGCGRRQ
jgi:hypothetical protein